MHKNSPELLIAEPSPAPVGRMSALGAEVVLTHGEMQFNDQYGARDVWVYQHDGTYFMHYDAAGEMGWLAALATSSDGLTWKKQGTILELGDEGQQDSASASYATTHFDGSSWHMFYLGTPNATPDLLKTPSFPYMTMKATSESPTGPWTKTMDAAPFRAEVGSWFSDTASPGAIVLIQGEYRMIFSAAMTASDGRIWRTLGTARTTDLNSSWTVDDEPLLPLTEQIENSSLYFEESAGLWFLFTNHVGRAADKSPEPPQNTSEYTDAVWVYWSDSLERFDPKNKAIVLDSSNCAWSPRVIGLPSVLPIGGRLAIFYDGAIEDSISHGYRDIGVAWLNLPLTPAPSS